MARINPRFIHAGGTAAAVAALLVAGGVGAQSAAARDTQPGTVLNVAVTNHNMYVDGPSSFPAGQVQVRLENAKTHGTAETAVIQLAAGYTWSDWRADFATLGKNLFGPGGDKKKGLKALNHAIDHLTLFGGVGADQGARSHGTLLLTNPGTYVIFNDSGQMPKAPHYLTVTAPEGPQVLPAATGYVVANTSRRFSGSAVLPKNGTIRFTNKSTESPHFLELQHVKEGTTRKQVIASLQSNQPPSFGLPGSAELEALSTNQSMDFHVNLPAGEYVEMCFFPDPKTGMPHALMGMVRVVHVK